MKNLESYNYGIIGNCTSAALVSSEGSIDWLCLPFFDSASLFARILDEKKGGFFKISAQGIQKISQSYVPDTAIINTTFVTVDGVFEVRDYMPRFIAAEGEHYCPSEVHRDILLISGRPKLKIEIDLRPNYAIEPAKVQLHSEYVKYIADKSEYVSFYLYSNLDYKKIIDSGYIELKEHSYLLLSYHEKLEPVDNQKIHIEYVKTKTYWLDWCFRTKLPKKYKEILTRSAITLKLLTYQRTGAVIAAATTSLPEIIGRERNWDYRYCWVRDASMVIDLYSRLGHLNTSTRFIQFILNRMLLKHENIAVMYGINGRRELPEIELSHLEGYRGSKPVRIGNDAYRQKQNDLYGQLIETIYTYIIIEKDRKFYLDEETWTLVRSLVRDVINTWREPDSGIWERRNCPEHYVHSKLMSWVAVDRAIKIAQSVGKTLHAKEWSVTAEAIKTDILAKGYNEEVNSFTMYYGSRDFDASNLLMLHYGFLNKSDPRMTNTVLQSYKNLVKNGFAFRYTCEDDFGKPENAFIVCTFWMINALYLIGETQKARMMLDNILINANELGLFSEDIEINSKRLTGNFPQGYSHLALIQTVLLLETDYNWSDAACHSWQQNP